MTINLLILGLLAGCSALPQNMRHGDQKDHNDAMISDQGNVDSPNSDAKEFGDETIVVSGTEHTVITSSPALHDDGPSPKETVMLTAALDNGGGVIDTSGGDPDYIDEESLDALIEALPSTIKAVFRRLDLFLKVDSGIDFSRQSYLTEALKLLKGSFLQRRDSRTEKEDIFALMEQNKIKITRQDLPCKVGDDHKTATIDTQGNICLDRRKLLSLPKLGFEQQFVSLIIHEIAHYYGFGESDADIIQRFFIYAPSLIIDVSDEADLETAILKNFGEFTDFIVNQDLGEKSQKDLCQLIVAQGKDLQTRFMNLQTRVLLTAALNQSLQDITNSVAIFCPKYIPDYNDRSLEFRAQISQDIVSWYDVLRSLKLAGLAFLGGDLGSQHFDQKEVIKKLLAQHAMISQYKIAQLPWSASPLSPEDGFFCNIFKGDDILDIPVLGENSDAEFTSNVGIYLSTFPTLHPRGVREYMQTANLRFSEKLSYEEFFNVAGQLSELDFMENDQTLSISLINEIRPYAQMSMLEPTKEDAQEVAMKKGRFMCALP